MSDKMFALQAAEHGHLLDGVNFTCSCGWSVEKGNYPTGLPRPGWDDQWKDHVIEWVASQFNWPDK